MPSDWKATRPPNVSEPWMTRKPPKPRIAAIVRPESSVGTMSNMTEEAPSPLFCVEGLGLNAGPLAEGVVFQPACLDCFDGPHHAHGRAEQLSLFEPQTVAQFLAASERQAAGQEH